MFVPGLDVADAMMLCRVGMMALCMMGNMAFCGMVSMSMLADMPMVQFNRMAGRMGVTVMGMSRNMDRPVSVSMPMP